MEKAVIYTRVSTDEQVSNFSLDSQESTCRDYASKAKLDVVKIFREEGVSAKTVAGRPELLKLLAFCRDRKNQVSKVLIYKYDRWSRNTEQGLQATTLLSSFGVELVSVTEPTENNAMGKAIRGLMLIVAQLDNDIKSERTTHGMQAAFHQGYWPWKAPIGYAHVIEEGKKVLILLPGYKEVLSRFFENAAAGIYTRKELANQLNEDGFSRLYESAATEKTVDLILKKKFYSGIMEAHKWGDEKLGNHEPIISEDLWLKANRAVYKNSKLAKRTNAVGLYPLRGFVRCKSCGHALTASHSTGRGGKYGYYHCAAKGCSKKDSFPQATLEEEFKEYIRKFTLSDIQRKLFAARLSDEVLKRQALRQKEAQKTEDELHRLEEEKRQVLKSVSKGIVTDEEAKSIIEGIRIKEAVLKIESSENRIDELETQNVEALVNYLLQDFSSLWSQLDHPRKRRLQETIFPKGVFYTDHFRTAQICESFQLIEEFRDQESSLVTLTLPHPHQLIADILDLFNTFADDLRGLSYNFAV